LQDRIEADLLAYHVLTHALITALEERLVGTTSKTFVNEYMVSVATEVSNSLVGGSDAPLLKMLRLLSSYGFRVEMGLSDASTDWVVSCPFAHSLHPKVPGHASCPVALLILGSIRLQKRDEKITHQTMTADGVEFRTEKGTFCRPVMLANQATA
jgi:hypothetical protein